MSSLCESAWYAGIGRRLVIKGAARLVYGSRERVEVAALAGLTDWRAWFSMGS